MRTALALIVIPRSLSSSMESMICACMSRRAMVPVISSRRSASVDLPWAMCAMMEKFRMREMSLIVSRVLFQEATDLVGLRAQDGLGDELLHRLVLEAAHRLLDAQEHARRDRHRVDAEADAQRDRARVRGHLAADADPLALRVRRADHVVEQADDGGVVRVVEVRDVLVDAVDGEHVLD